ncbi:MAG: hypothetical protein FWC00_04215 [Firmicutes bacterium]|nr:hypothetical protein [Bacillota bacterium]
MLKTVISLIVVGIFVVFGTIAGVLLIRGNNVRGAGASETIQYTVQSRVEGSDRVPPFQPRTATIDANRALDFNLYANGRGYNEFANFNLVAFEIDGVRFERGQNNAQSVFFSDGRLFQTNRAAQRFTADFTVTVIYVWTGTSGGTPPAPVNNITVTVQSRIVGTTNVGPYTGSVRTHNRNNPLDFRLTNASNTGYNQFPGFTLSHFEIEGDRTFFRGQSDSTGQPNSARSAFFTEDGGLFQTNRSGNRFPVGATPTIIIWYTPVNSGIVTETTMTITVTLHTLNTIPGHTLPNASYRMTWNRNQAWDFLLTTEGGNGWDQIAGFTLAKFVVNGTEFRRGQGDATSHFFGGTQQNFFQTNREGGRFTTAPTIQVWYAAVSTTERISIVADSRVNGETAGRPFSYFRVAGDRVNEWFRGDLLSFRVGAGEPYNFAANGLTFSHITINGYRLTAGNTTRTTPAANGEIRYFFNGTWLQIVHTASTTIMFYYTR